MKQPQAKSLQAWMGRFAKTLSARLSEQPEAAGLKLLALGSPTEDDTVDGWWVDIAVLRGRKPRLIFDLWLDKYLDSGEHHLCYGVASRQPRVEPFEHIAKTLERSFGTPLRFGDGDIDQSTFAWLPSVLMPKSRQEYEQPILYSHKGGSAGYVRYEYEPYPRTPKVEAAVIDRAVGFYLDIAEAWRHLEGGGQTLPSQPLSAAAQRQLEQRTSKSAESELEVRNGGQGFLGSQAVREAIDQYAMKRAISRYAEEGYAWEDTHKNHPFDLRCSKNGKTIYVEVKGTTTPGASVIVSNGTREWATRHEERMHLFVLHSIRLSDPEHPKPSGGREYRIRPWHVTDGVFTPISFHYQLPTL